DRERGVVGKRGNVRGGRVILKKKREHGLMTRGTVQLGMSDCHVDGLQGEGMPLGTRGDIGYASGQSRKSVRAPRRESVTSLMRARYNRSTTAVSRRHRSRLPVLLDRVPLLGSVPSRHPAAPALSWRASSRPPGLGGGHFFFSSRRRHTRLVSDWSSDVCSSDLAGPPRRDTGQGERIEIAMQDAMLQYIRVALSNQATYGVAAQRNGSKVISGFAVPSGIYPCKPGGPNDYLYVYTSRTNPVHWQRLLEVIGRKDLIGDPRFDTAAARLKHEPEVDAMIAAWTRQHDKREAMRVLGGAGVPAGAIFDTMELTEDADFEQRGIMQTMEHPLAGPFKMPGWPVRFGGRTPEVKPSPLLGQHTNEVLGEWLSL